jgi:dTDP-4-amino-4,6-dideoxygalactose transaminase/CBS domain-containing protein
LVFRQDAAYAKLEWWRLTNPSAFVHADTLLLPTATISDAFESLTQSGKGAALLLDSKGRLQHLFTDGDLRRVLLAGQSIETPLAQLKHKTPHSVSPDVRHHEALMLMDRYRIDQLPVLDNEGRPVGLHLRRDIGSRIWLSTPHIGEEELQFVNQAFASNWIAPLGPNVDAFEREVAAKVEVGHAAALSSGTAAIHLALILLGISRGDRVLCSSLTFVASANPILYVGAEPLFVDAEAGSWNMCPIALERALEQSAREGRPAKAVMVVDIYGQAADYDRIRPICDRYGVPIIEDAAEALGASYGGKPCGGFGRIGVFSFNGNKIITTSGGGMLVADDADLVQHARKLATQAREDCPWYEHKEIGYNYRMSNVLAGIGRGQLSRLEERVAARRAIFERYHEALAQIDAIEWMPEYEGSFSNRWLTTCTLGAGIDPQAVCDDLARLDIEVRRVWKPMHRQPLFASSQFVNSGSNLDVAGDLFERGLCLPSGSNMTEEQIDRVCDALSAALRRADRT